METIEIVYWLRDKAARAHDLSHTRAADRLKELDKPQKTAHWIIHGEGAIRWVECSECHVCGCSRWNVCPVCESKMEVNNG